MYKQEELLQKVDGHLKENDIKLLKSLISDLDEFNERYGNGIIETYIDFDNVGDDTEYDPYETFSIRLHNKVEKTKHDENVHDYLDIHQLDDCLCTIELYHEEMQEMMRPVNESLKNANDDIEEKIREAEKEDKIVFFDDADRLVTISLDTFTKQPLNGQLYELNRLREVILTFRDKDWSKHTQRWVNDIALVNLLEYYYKKCKELDA